MIKDAFYSSLGNHTNDPSQIDKLWQEIETNYSKSNRHYHNLIHLDNLTRQLISFQSSFQNWDVVILAIAYHDAVYNVLKKNNEEKSATLASKRLGSFLPEQMVNFCHELILATKAHQTSDNKEVNLFTDADLSILGVNAKDYQIYAEQVRNEYSIFPDLVYNPGRKKVLAHFLAMQRIFKTEEFYNLYEQQARINLKAELARLGG